MHEPAAQSETDPRFPSGPWTGFFLQPQIPGRHWMELDLTFQHGVVSGTGRDWVGHFGVRGSYSLEDGKCHWSKRYVGMHDVIYQGYNEGKGIWGKWEIPADQNTGFHWTGGFHIWPKGMHDPTLVHSQEEADPPITIDPNPGELIEIGAAMSALHTTS